MRTTGAPSGRWWRFEEYAISDGYIRPRWPTRMVEYDPWAGFWRGPRARVSHRPYQELINLVRGIAVHESGEVELNAAQQQTLLGWCSRYGLLGLLPHASSIAVVEWRTSEPGRTYFVRNADGWYSWTELDRVMYEHESRPTGERRSEAIVQHPLGMIQAQALHRAWGRFFPSENAERDWGTLRGAPPQPLSDEFWHRYAEPVSEFVGAAQRLGAALTVPPRPKASRSSPKLDLLDRLVAGSEPVLERGSHRRFQFRWRPPSLLATLALMGMQDLTHERRLYQCPCGNVVTSTDPKTKYCSPQHRERYRKQAWREQTKRTKRTSGAASNRSGQKGHSSW